MRNDGHKTKKKSAFKWMRPWLTKQNPKSKMSIVFDDSNYY